MGFHSRATPFNFIRGKIDHQWTSFSPFMSITSDSAQANILQRWNSFFQNGCSWTEILNSFLKNVNLRLIPQNTNQKLLFNDSPPTLVHFAVLLLVCPIGPDISPSYFSHCLASPTPSPLFLLALHHRLNRNKAPLSREKERNLRMPVRTNISGIFLWLYVNTGLQNSFHPAIPGGRTWSKFGEHGDHGKHGDELDEFSENFQTASEPPPPPPALVSEKLCCAFLRQTFRI